MKSSSKWSLVGIYIFLCLLLVGCTKQTQLDETKMSKNEYTLKELKNQVAAVLKDTYWPNEQLEEKQIEEEIGISKSQYEECFVERTHLKDNVDQLILIKCKEEELSNIEMMMENYRNQMIETHKEQFMNRAKAEASRMEVIEEYVCFVQLGGDLSPLPDDREVQIRYCQEQNEKAIDVLEKMLLSS